MFLSFAAYTRITYGRMCYSDRWQFGLAGNVLVGWS